MVTVDSNGRGTIAPILGSRPFQTVMAQMDILNPAVVDITSKGLSVDCVATGPQLGLLEPDDKFEGPLTIHLELTKQDGPIAATGTLEGTAIRQCVRCLTEYAEPLLVSVYAEFMRQAGPAPKPATAEPRRRELKRAAVPEDQAEETAAEEDEIYFYQGEHLDLSQMLREQVILAAPMHPLCREECQGLCPQCGQNLNERRCACPPEQGPNPFRVLKEREAKQSKGGNA